jgi:hypothetical protein
MAESTNRETSRPGILHYIFYIDCRYIALLSSGMVAKVFRYWLPTDMVAKVFRYWLPPDMVAKVFMYWLPQGMVAEVLRHSCISLLSVLGDKVFLYWILRDIVVEIFFVFVNIIMWLLRYSNICKWFLKYPTFSCLAQMIAQMINDSTWIYYLVQVTNIVHI